jgi:hypothetical protein
MLICKSRIKDLQAVCIDEESSQLGGSNLRQIHRHSGLQHANAHAGEEFRDKPVIPTVGEGLRKDTLRPRHELSKGVDGGNLR